MLLTSGLAQFRSVRKAAIWPQTMHVSTYNAIQGTVRHVGKSAYSLLLRVIYLSHLYAQYEATARTHLSQLSIYFRNCEKEVASLCAKDKT